MPLRSSDTTYYKVSDVSTYPRAIDFPLQCTRGLNGTIADQVNMNNGLILCRARIRNNIGGPVSIMYDTSRRAPEGAFMAITMTNHLSYNPIYSRLIDARYMNPSASRYIDGVFYVGGSPCFIAASINIVVHDKTELSCVSMWRSNMQSSMMGWSRVEVSIEDIATIVLDRSPVGTTLANWIMNHNDSRIIYPIWDELRYGGTLYKVTNDETGRGYVEIMRE